MWIPNHFTHVLVYFHGLVEFVCNAIPMHSISLLNTEHLVMARLSAFLLLSL